MRRPVDLPWRGRPVRFKLTVRRFRCVNPACQRRTFAEDCRPNLPRYARRTLEAREHLLKLGQTSGGEAGARIAKSEGLPTSPDTLLRLVRASAPAEAPTPRVLGIDDFSLRRRHKYGTIFVNLETSRPVDMVEGREAETVAKWLKGRSGIQVIARDRSGAYDEGAKAGAPQAVQVADRFHLVQNASAALDGLLRGRRLGIEEAGDVEATAEVPNHPSATGDAEEPATVPLSPTKQYQAERCAARIARWQRVKALAEDHVSARQIAREVGVSRVTVRRLLDSPEPPHNRLVRHRPGGLHSPTLQPFVTYLQDRWEEGCTNVAQLHREISAKGYGGSRSLLAQAVKPWRGPSLPRKERRQTRRLTRRLSMRWLCLKPPKDLKPKEKVLLNQLLAQDADLATGYQLLQRFRRVIAERDIPGMDSWLNDAKGSGLPTFVALANGIDGDRAAVDAGLRLPWSNGPTEGHITRLKLIKRQGYGRAKLDLLRARVLAS